MTHKGLKARKLLLAAISLILIAAIAAAAYLYQAEQQRQAEEAAALTEQGIAQFQQKEYQAALETLSSISPGVIEDWRIPYYMGVSYIRLKNYEPAAVSLEQALLLNRTEKGIPFSLGVIYFKLGNLSLSKSYFHSVLELDPAHEEAKGLMDIMAKLERLQPDEPAPESESNKTGLLENSSQPTDLTSTSEGKQGTGN